MVARNRPSFGEGGEPEHGVLSSVIAQRPATMGLAPRMPAAARPAPELLAKLWSLVEEVARRAYPAVWVGEEGMTALELLELQERNEGRPEEKRWLPGQVLIPGQLAMPKVGVPRISGLDAVMRFREEVYEDHYWDLWEHVAGIVLAREGKVVTKAFSSGHPPDPVYHLTTVDNIPAERVEYCAHELANNCPMNPEAFVIHETERVKAFLAEYGEYFG